MVFILGYSTVFVALVQKDKIILAILVPTRVMDPGVFLIYFPKFK